MATLKWEIMETYCIAKRDDLLQGLSPERYWYDYTESLIAETSFYERDDEEKSLYRDKNITTPDDAFAYLNNLIQRRENAFLWNRRL